MRVSSSENLIGPTTAASAQRPGALETYCTNWVWSSVWTLICSPFRPAQYVVSHDHGDCAVTTEGQLSVEGEAGAAVLADAAPSTFAAGVDASAAVGRAASVVSPPANTPPMPPEIDWGEMAGASVMEILNESGNSSLAVVRGCSNGRS